MPLEESLSLPTRNLLTGYVVDSSSSSGENLSPGFESPVEEVQGLSLVWKDVCVFRRRRLHNSIWRPAKYEDVKVLDQVSGVVTQGNLIAIMGASGAGKTSLLAAISQRERNMTGTLLLNGRPATASLASISGFVPQHELTVDDLSVGEHMTFMSRLMMDRDCSSRERSQRVLRLLSELSVARCVNTKLSALSGGERKRISLAVQLLNDPPLLFCDEPTTGLDSWAARGVLSRLRSLARAGKLVACSVHQPASGMFELFDQLVLLAGGRLAFHGSVHDAAHFFTGLGFKCPVGYNPAEFYVGLVCSKVGDEARGRERVRLICDRFRGSEIAAEMDSTLRAQLRDSYSYRGEDDDNEEDLFERLLSIKKVGALVQFYWCMWRNIIALRRSYFTCVFDVIIYLTIGLVVSIPYIGLTSRLGQRDIQNLEGLMYLTVTETIFTFAYNVFVTFPRELPAFLRESADGLYCPAAYYFSKIIYWMPRAVLVPAAYSALVFFIAGLSGGVVALSWFALVCVLCAMTANSYGSFLSGTFESIETAALVSVPADQLGLILSGIFFSLNSLSPIFSWMRFLSPFYYGTEAVSIIQWQTVTRINCSDTNPINCVRTGEDVLRRYGYVKDNFWIDIVGLCGLYVVYNVLSFVMVKRRSKRAAVY